jgi:hypothetical protein
MPTIALKSSLAGSVAAFFLSCGCVPVHPTATQLVGSWRVVWDCGTESLELKSDATYRQGMDYAGGGHATHSGTWRITPKQSVLEGAQVVLTDASEFCSAFGEKLKPPVGGDRQLEAVWEWGRVTLNFNPDIQGFERR